MLGKRELYVISQMPQALDVGLVYLNQLKSRGKILEAYTIAPTYRMTHVRRRLLGEGPQTSNFPELQSVDHPTGIAIAEAKSIEDAKTLIENMGGATPEGIPFLSYLDYSIYPLTVIEKEESSELKGTREREVSKTDRLRRSR